MQPSLFHRYLYWLDCSNASNRMEVDFLGFGAWAEIPATITHDSKVMCNHPLLTTIGSPNHEFIGNYCSLSPSTKKVERRPSPNNMNLHQHVLAEGSRERVIMLDRFLDEVPPPLSESSSPRRKRCNGKPRYSAPVRRRR